ncbi:MAG: cupredoxin domain-containing protein [Gammaproteobacteria bacterium]
MNNTLFNPSSLAIKRCDTVVWTHQQPNVPHSVTSGQLGAGNAGAEFDSTGGLGFGKLMNNGETFSHTFNNAGTFPYHCIVHGAGGPNQPPMIGTITVSP